MLWQKNIAERKHFDFKLLLPLIQETAMRIQTINPSEAQTGPALRHDAATIKKHERAVKENILC